jgi:4-diphosphocytidyl-2-C-methyl-D-erythritol kinase
MGSTRPGRAVTSARAFAKLTLALRVLGARPDGYHDIEALTVSLGQPHDTLEVESSAEPGVSLVVDADDDAIPSGDDNLAVRAADALLERVGASRGVEMTLAKRIPAGGGLGGASADAAAALVAVRAELDLDVDDVVLDELAIRLGADVPFCLRGGAARMSGRGERLDPVDLPLGLPFLLAVAPFRCSTAAVYAAWDDLGGPRSTRTVAAPPAIAAVVPELVNDLEPAAEHVAWQLAEFRERLEAAAGRPAILAGSGSTYAVAVEDASELPQRAAEVSERFSAEVIPAATVSRGVRLS